MISNYKPHLVTFRHNDENNPIPNHFQPQNPFGTKHAESVNSTFILKGRHDDRNLSDKRYIACSKARNEMNDIQELKSQINIVQHITQETGYSHKRVGTDTVDLSQCPYCQGHDCFRINTHDQYWKCFQCHCKGDVLSFTQTFKHLGTKAAIQYLSNKYNIDITRNIQSLPPTLIQEIKNSAFTILNNHSQSNLNKEIQLNHRKMSLLNYLRTIRKHSDAVIESMRVVPSHTGLTDSLLSKGFPMKDIQKAGFANQQGKDYYPENVLLIPVIYQGQLSHFDVKDPSSKMTYKSKKIHRNPDALFLNMDAIEHTDKCVVVEGANDVMSIIDKGKIDSVIATLGQLTCPQIKWLVNKVKTRKMKLYLCFDNDAAGVGYTHKLIGEFQKESLHHLVRIITFENANDIDEYLGTTNTPQQDFQSRLSNAQKVPDTSYRVMRKNNRYYHLKLEKKDDPKLIPISNFTFSVENELHTEEDCIRDLQLTNSSGQVEGVFSFTTKQLASLQDFTQRLLQAGTFGFWGSLTDLKETVLLELSKYSGRKIYLLDHVGYSEKHQFWIYQNGIIKNHQLYPSDEKGIVWTTEEIGFKIQSLNVSEQTSLLPCLTPLYEDDADVLLNAFLEVIKSNLGGYEGWLAYGFVVASVYAPEIFRKQGYFPFLFLIGKHQSGKNVLANILLRAMGIPEIEMESLPAVRSFVGIMRKLGYFSNGFVWLDEYRSNSRNAIDGLLRNIY
ncbi:MAG: toprim domain-containing protein, partial [Candidatus Margulisbacteria bacterium]|nr:toprim domain-containing protein [Candidatus Margulisiibacteriota bacterium]